VLPAQSVDNLVEMAAMEASAAAVVAQAILLFIRTATAVPVDLEAEVAAVPVWEAREEKVALVVETVLGAATLEAEHGLGEPAVAQALAARFSWGVARCG
jgi:hypothetical protein